MTQSPSIPPFPALRTAAMFALLMAGGTAAAAVALAAAGLWEEFPAAALTAGVCLMGAMAGLEPVRRGSRISLEHTVMACVTGMITRMVTTLLGGVGLIYGAGLNTRVVAGWILIWYLLLLAMEVWLLVRYFNTLSSAEAKARGSVEGISGRPGGEVKPCSH